MDQKQVDLFYGAMLHDIGKVVQRANNQRVKHSKLGKDYLKQFNFNKAVLDQVAYHHAYELLNSNLEDDNLAYITYIADNIASGIDRRSNMEHREDQLFKPDLPLEDIFNRFGDSTTHRYFIPRTLDVGQDPNYPQEKPQSFTSSQYGGILNKIETTLKVISPTVEYQASLLNLMEATLSYVPSSTNTEEVADISLFDHIKVTAAIATSIYQFLEESNRHNYKKDLFVNASDFYLEKAFLLVSFDLSGIQDFIYTIASKGAHKQLRSRSFYLEMISEWLADTILKSMHLSRANLLYTGGGHAYLILPNTENARNQLNEIEQSFNQFFLTNFGTKLFVAIGNTPFAAKEVMQNSKIKEEQVTAAAEYRAIFQSVGQEISQKKLQRYTPEVIQQLNQYGKRAGRECSVCHTIHNLRDNHDNDTKCEVCYGLENFSKVIQNEDYFVVGSNKSALAIGPNAYLDRTTEKAILNGEVNGSIYTKNNQMTGINQAVHIWVADYSVAPNNEFSYYTQREWTKENNEIIGIKRLGVLRADVDDLGLGFMAGYSTQAKGMYNTLSRTAAFSRNMSLFFKLYINKIAEAYRLTIVYSGGDDVFAIGAWDDILDFTIQLREDFLYWTNGKLTLSAGIGMFHDKTPINIMARQTGELEEAAKSSGKNAICLFDAENTFNFDEYIDDIQNNYLEVVTTYFNTLTLRGKSFVYKLLQLIEERNEVEKISFARLAYTIARLEDETKKTKVSSLDVFNTFKQTLMQAFSSEKEIKKFGMALRLYIYKERKEG
ncbi:type III-A CRISPR-associated protein Cas10/Csm1 [Fundicoccus culcitae]|uniref:CRISPR system single-strand-specific deoxyribonuclease Cas10/Csm1 (subtype III-A) n=1 Tax=Fundicoccus culcitae TaxID=2969821 RepID=A0ABY5P4U1_9LACT|nr:type III-A CRISPR-associated protein Cas10/Csm1 [Fundicoccus culcitae]UUX33726.1 type III-A CRISPR-associated protein Cas10/Csm1 [Fundicoccus culcitae]